VLPDTTREIAPGLGARPRSAPEDASEEMTGRRILSMSAGARGYPENGASRKAVRAEAGRPICAEESERHSRRAPPIGPLPELEAPAHAKSVC
jgi:hypothetical protein